ncbi:MAG: tripartite tricarboxylate transporter substrate binding protein, partial [Xanthobacteraceae bacterium]
MRKLGLLVLMTIIGAWAGIARGQNVYPSQPVRIIIPFPAGSTTDTLTRIVADQLSRKWSKAVVVENVPGMNIGAE